MRQIDFYIFAKPLSYTVLNLKHLRCAASTGVFVDAILGCCGGDFCGFFGLGCTTGTGLVVSGRDDNDDLLGGGGGCLTTGDVTTALSGTSTDCGNESGGFSSALNN